jgi:hypothetical protein
MSKSLTNNLKSGTYTREGEVLSGYSYYDTVLMSNTVNSHRMFTVPQSAAKPRDLTNMTIGGQMPSGQKLTIFNIKVFLCGAAAIDETVLVHLYDMISRSTVDLVIENKAPMLTLTLQELLGAASLFELTPSVAGDNISGQILPRFHGIYPLNIPIVLQELTPFEVLFVHQAAVANNEALNNVRVKISLNGELLRRT